MDEKYIKIIYKSEPIGRDKIVLYLTTFDDIAYKKDEKLKEVPIKNVAYNIEVDKRDFLYNPRYIQLIEELLNNKVDEFYKKEIEKLKISLESERKIKKIIGEARWIEKV